MSLNTVSGSLGRGWRAIRDVVLNPPSDAAGDEVIAARARAEAPVVWLLGKVQSGKSTIVRAITGSPDVEIGAGYRPCTRNSRIYDVPVDAPVIRFLDTVGFDEVGYDPAEDLAELERHAHVVLAVARAMDPQQDSLLRVLREVRRRHPEWAVVLAQTALHEGYPDGADHPPYEALHTASGLEDLRRCLAQQAAPFLELAGRGEVLVVPVDFTRAEDGYADTRFGLDALLDALERAGSLGMENLLRTLAQRLPDPRAERARAHILGYAIAAGATDALPGVGVVSVPTIQGKLLHSIASIYALPWDRRTLQEFAASLGAGTLLGIGISFGVRQLAKLVPVYGQTVGAAAAGAAGFAVTWALGRAACYYLGNVRDGRGEMADVRRVYRESLQEAFELARRSRRKAGESGESAGETT
jgi:uncharacterized protein (DUF697 family)